MRNGGMLLRTEPPETPAESRARNRPSEMRKLMLRGPRDRTQAALSARVRHESHPPCVCRAGFSRPEVSNPQPGAHDRLTEVLFEAGSMSLNFLKFKNYRYLNIRRFHI